jgi:hypothetical protein
LTKFAINLFAMEMIYILPAAFAAAAAGFAAGFLYKSKINRKVAAHGKTMDKQTVEPKRYQTDFINIHQKIKQEAPANKNEQMFKKEAAPSSFSSDYVFLMSKANKRAENSSNKNLTGHI